jgi:PIN like domain
MSDQKAPFPDPLVRQRLFPEAAKVFEFAPKPLKQIFHEAVVVIDTNVLLVPYNTGKASLDQIRKIYQRLASEGRLRVPGQVAREFADNRAEKLKTLFQQLSRKRDTSLTRSEYPLLEGIAAYAELVKQEEGMLAALTNYRKHINDLLEVVAGWHWNDPVSAIYRDLFKPPNIVDLQFDRDDLLKELKYRQEHRIPPGYKDSNNEYSGVGDLIIWKTVLAIGEKESRDVVFVSGDEKTDWRYQSEGRALYPRFELLDEYRRASNGKSLLMISFAELLEQSGAPAPVVAEVKQEEAVASLAVQSILRGYREGLAENAVFRWLCAQYPNTEIRRSNRFPDFIVRSTHGFEGYEVKHMSSRDIFRRIIDALEYIKHRSTPEVPISLVVVVHGDLPPLAVFSRVLERAIDSGIRIIVGELVEEAFHERWRSSGDKPQQDNQ